MTTDPAGAETLGARTNHSQERSRHHWSDWVGFIASSAALVWAATKGSGLTVYALPVMFLQFLNAMGYLLRGPARHTLSGLAPRAAAYGTTYLIPACLLAAGRWTPHLIQLSGNPMLKAIGGVLGSAGLLLAVLPFWYLRHSFSIEPVARTLVTTGPYALARHPIYSSYLLSYLGLLISAPRMLIALVLIIWVVALRIRVGFEERVLVEAFPAYAAYRARVGMFGPKLRFRKASR